MTERKILFVDVILPVSIYNEFTYRVPKEMNSLIQKGIRVVVPFGKAKFYTAVVTNIHQEAPQQYEVKNIEYILDEQPIITGRQYTLWKWIARYYLAAIGDVLNAALPANFKLASETKIALHPDYHREHKKNCTSNEQSILDSLEINEEQNLKDLSELIDVKNIHPIIKRLIDKKLVVTLEELKQKYTAKKESFVWLNPVFSQEDYINLFETLEKNGKNTQLDALTEILRQKQTQNSEYVLKKTLIQAGVSNSTLQTLKKNAYIEIERLEVSRLSTLSAKQTAIQELSEDQQRAYIEIKKNFETHFVTLLFGVTGSGKTEVYMKLIQETLQAGKQVLFLLPEIALTVQLIDRLSVYFGDLIGVYHSRFNSNERVEIWNAVLENNPTRYRLIVGARSSVFLPFKNLGLIIVDEEHETSFKQNDPAPRYNARDTAIMMAKLHDAKILLGSATPAMETYYNAQNGKYGIVKLSKRYSGVQLPKIECIDMRKARLAQEIHADFSTVLLGEIKRIIEQKKQVILFQNRRGYTPMWMCEICHWTPRCTNCDVSLTYHKTTNLLTCHYCSHVQHPMGTCPNCGSNRLKMLGFGTEKIEDDLSLFLPAATIKRLDMDTTRSKSAYQTILTEFDSQKIDILIGTQMVSKGLDFKNVALVGILDADLMLRRSDFRAFEKSFQLMSQVAGRAGRKQEQGKVLIQTRDIDHWVIQKIIQHDYEGFYSIELSERQNYFYPPYYKLINIILKHKDEALVSFAADQFAELLRAVFKERVLGPEFPPVKRIQNRFLKQIKIKIEKDVPDAPIKEKITELMNVFYSKPKLKPVFLAVDIDPL